MASYTGQVQILGHSVPNTFEVGRKIEHWPSAGPMGCSIEYEGPAVIDAVSSYMTSLRIGDKIPDQVKGLCEEPMQLDVHAFTHGRLVELKGENTQSRLAVRLALEEHTEQLGTLIDFSFSFNAKGLRGKVAEVVLAPLVRTMGPAFALQFHRNVESELNETNTTLTVPGLLLPKVA